MSKYIKGYEVEEDDGKRLLGTLDLIVELEKMAKDRSRKRRNRKTSRLMVKWLRSLVRSYGIAIDPFKNAVLYHYNVAKHREEDVKASHEELKKDIARYFDLLENYEDYTNEFIELGNKLSKVGKQE